MLNVYRNIKALRNQKQLSQTEMAEKLGLSQNAYNKLERGVTQITLERLEQIATIFDMKVEDLINEEIFKLKRQNDLLNKRVNELENEGNIDFTAHRLEMDSLKKEIKYLKNQLKKEEELSTALRQTLKKEEEINSALRQTIEILQKGK